MNLIPIVVKTNSIFPYEDLIDYNKMGVFVEECELNENNTLKDIILNYYNKKTKEELIEIQKYNRNIYLTYFHSDVFWEQIFNYFYKCEDYIFKYNIYFIINHKHLQ